MDTSWRMTSHLSQALVAFLSGTRQSGTAFASKIGVHQTTISRITAGERPAVDTLRGMCTRWPDSRATLGLLVAHLRDEIDRAGRTQAEVDITAAEVEDDDIHLLARESTKDPELAGLLRQMAELIRAHRAREARAAQASAAATSQPIRYPQAADQPDATLLAAEQEAGYRTTEDNLHRAILEATPMPPLDAPAPKPAESGPDSSKAPPSTP